MPLIKDTQVNASLSPQAGTFFTNKDTTMKTSFLRVIAAAAVCSSSMVMIHVKPASAGWFTNCSEIRDGFSLGGKKMVCDGDFGDRVLVECDSLGSSCIKLCTIGGIMDGCR